MTQPPRPGSSDIAGAAAPVAPALSPTEDKHPHHQARHSGGILQVPVMTPPQDIAQRPARAVSHSLSVSPSTTFQSPPSSHSFVADGGQGHTPKQLKPFDTGDIKILLLENVNQTGRDILHAQGYQVESLKSSLPEAELIEKIRCVFFSFFFFLNQ